MEILNSAWLLHMLDDGGKTPSEKLLSIFTCLDNWLSAPSLREKFIQDFKLTQPLYLSCPVLTNRLIQFALAAKVQKPDEYVIKMMILLQGAFLEELRSPGSGSLLAAKTAARCLLNDSMRKPKLNSKIVFAFAASISTLVFGLAMQINSLVSNQFSADYQASITNATNSSRIDPDLLEKVTALQAEINSGHCPSPQLFVIPQDEVGPYMDTIQYRTSKQPLEDSKKLKAFLAWYTKSRAWECYYPPTNGHTTVSWTKS